MGILSEFKFWLTNETDEKIWLKENNVELNNNTSAML